MTDYERVEKIILYLNEHYRSQPDLRTLAKVAGLSEFHFHRLFTRWAGVTPKTFLQYLTARHAKALLQHSRSVLDTSLESGLSGPGRLHDLLITVEGVTPGEFKARGKGISISYCFHASPFGICLIGVTGRGVCHLAFLNSGDEDTALKALGSAWPEAEIQKDAQTTAHIAAAVFSRRKSAAKVSLSLAGTPFQLKVWEAVLRIPPGRVLSYKDIGRILGMPGAPRAVGTALASNPVAYLIPCHRVIRETGIIGDYRWGNLRKQAILAHEMAAASGKNQAAVK
jgi:AraC family transcriptional regulator of adaptative response/methylated-DNA-[protein]-cysteine methyltransferase